ncbi:MAG: TIR domain-containing protein [Microscillaceae bacterium]|nr:TIR domain-containing protein [Microscillaceae bacterium]
MKAFVSYSLNDTDEYVITILAKKLQEQGFYVSAGHNLHFPDTNPESLAQIRTSDLFIGILTYNGQINERVQHEWLYAQEAQKSAILMVEWNVALDEELNNSQNIVRFNRQNPDRAIESIHRYIDGARQNAGLADKNDVFAWILAGMALIKLVRLLSKN